MKVNPRVIPWAEFMALPVEKRIELVNKINNKEINAVVDNRIPAAERPQYDE